VPRVDVRHAQTTRRVLELHIGATIGSSDGFKPRMDSTFCHLAEVNRHLVGDLPVGTSVHDRISGIQHTVIIPQQLLAPCLGPCLVRQY